MCVKLDHPAVMPRWLARDLIVSWSNEKEIVLDPFVGSGTTIEEAIKINRQSLGFEINVEYFNAAEKRIKKAQEQGKIGSWFE